MGADRSESLLEAIVADPDDDGARLVYADWLDERGDTDRAAFIRLQVARAGLPEHDPGVLPLLSQERALLERYEREWRSELPQLEGVRWGEFRRGFVAAASFQEVDSFEACADRLWEVAPVESLGIPFPGEALHCGARPGLRELHLHGKVFYDEDLSAIAELPLLSTLRTLSASGTALGPDHLVELLDSPHLDRLEVLWLYDNRLDNEVIEVLVEAIHLGALAEIGLGQRREYEEEPYIDEDGAAMLASWPGLRRLRTLDLSGHRLGADGMAALLSSLHAGNLRSLTVRDGDLDPDAAAAFGDATAALRLDALDLGENPLGDRGAEALLTAPCLRELRDLSLDRCELAAPAFAALARAPLVVALRRLDASDNDCDADGLRFPARPRAGPAHPEPGRQSAGGCGRRAAGAAPRGRVAAAGSARQRPERGGPGGAGSGHGPRRPVGAADRPVRRRGVGGAAASIGARAATVGVENQRSAGLTSPVRAGGLPALLSAVRSCGR